MVHLQWPVGPFHLRFAPPWLKLLPTPLRDIVSYCFNSFKEVWRRSRYERKSGMEQKLCQPISTSEWMLNAGKCSAAWTWTVTILQEFGRNKTPNAKSDFKVHPHWLLVENFAKACRWVNPRILSRKLCRTSCDVVKPSGPKYDGDTSNVAKTAGCSELIPITMKSVNLTIIFKL